MTFKYYLENPESSKLVKRANEVATELHKKQTRKTGGPYIQHPRRVAEIIKKYSDKKHARHLIAAALLHDTVEDTKFSVNQMKNLFGGLVSTLVDELTSNKELIHQQGKAKYLGNKMSTMSDYGLLIKLADRLDNISDLNQMDDMFKKKYTDETNEILDRVENKRKLNKTQKKIISLIRKKLK